MEVYLDIETAPMDFSTNQPLFNNVKENIKPDGRAKDPTASKVEKFNKLIEESALEPLLNRIVAISYAFDESDPVCQVSADEHAILDTFRLDFNNAINKYIASNLLSQSLITLITFNGQSFDLPILRIKLAKHQIAHFFSFNPKRYDQERHFDVREALTNFDQYGRGTQEQWALHFGIPVDYEGVSGKDIPDLFEAKEFSTIAKKGITDIKVLRQLYHTIERYY
jgi:Predicted 3'-5' exonuclease related to the exonuclease domain of PolB